MPDLSAFEYLTLRNDDAARRLIAPEIESFVAEDRAHGGHLIDTLLAYADADLNAKAAAEALLIHPNTAHYRLARIAETDGQRPAPAAGRHRPADRDPADPAMKEAFVEVSGLRLRVGRHGEGPPLLLITGIGANLDMWAPLERLLPGRELVGVRRARRRPLPAAHAPVADGRAWRASCAS